MESTVVTIFPPAREEPRVTAGCPHCRRLVEIADAAFVSLYAHEECAPKIRARTEPLPWLERVAGKAGVIAVVALVAMVIGAAMVGG